MASNHTSAGNKENIPYEIWNRMKWDKELRAQYKIDYPLSEIDDDSDDDESLETQSLAGPYVSGGGSTKSPNTDTIPIDAAFSNRVSQENDKHGFQPVPAKRFGRQIPNPHGQTSAKPRMPRRANLNPNQDNTAKAAFRKREPAVDEFMLDRDCDQIWPDLPKMYEYMEELGVRQGTFLRPPQHPRDRKILLWGSAEQVEKTKLELKSWMNPARTASTRMNRPSQEKFAEIHSSTGTKYKQIQDMIKKQAEMQEYQRVPAKDTVFPFQGCFLWDADVKPQEILGDGLEAMDPIRFSYRCHIIYDEVLLSFRVFSNKSDSINKTFKRIEGIMKEYRARTNRTMTRYALESHDEMLRRKDIHMVDRSGAGSKSIPMMTGRALEPADRVTLNAQLKEQSIYGIEEALRLTIPSLIFYRGQVRMRVNIGTFELTTFRWPPEADSVPFETFNKNLMMKGTRANLIKDLYIKKETSVIMDFIYKADKIFQPIDNMTPSLKEVTPSLSAYFECSERDRSPVKYQVDFVENAGEAIIYDKSNEMWLTTSRGDISAAFNIFMIRLDGGPSWKLGAATENPIDQSRTTPRMKAFASSVKLKNRGSMIGVTGERAVIWEDSLGSMDVSSFEQKTALRYRLVDHMDWVVEIARYDKYSKGAVRSQSKPMETSWAARMWNTDWDSGLVANQNMKIGQFADWNPTINTFFPRDSGKQIGGKAHEGVAKFLEAVGQVTRFLDEVRKEMPHLRR